MKKLLLLISSLLLIVLISRLNAQALIGYGVGETSLSTASTGVVTGTSFAVPTTYAALISWTVVADGSAISVNLEGSLDNSAWFTVDSITTPASGALRNFGFTAIKFVRISQVSRTGGTLTTGSLVVNRGFITASGSGSLSSLNLTGPFTTTGQVLLADGTAAVPSLAFGSDTTSGWTKGGTGQWNFVQGGSNRAFLTSSSWTLPTQVFLGVSQDMSFSRIAAGQWSSGAVLFASLGTPANGTICYCSDCTIANPCTGAGTGALAKRLAGVWVCN